MVGTYAQAAFFLLKTLPQMISTHAVPALQDREIARKINPAEAPPRNLAENCALILGKLPLINLPRLRK
jgi:hypothetical protein